MLIKTRPAFVSISLEACTPTKDRPVPTTESISFGLIPTDERDHLDLDTGEVFQDYNYARLHKKEQKLIDARVSIYPISDDQDYRYNVMHYMAEARGDDYYFPSSIFFRVFIPQTAFRDLLENIKSSLLPETITIELTSPQLFTTDADRGKKPPVEYGWEPDGSGLIWHNKENKQIPVMSVKFDFPVVKPRYDQKQPDRPLPVQFNAPTDRISEQIAQMQTILADISKRVRWTTMGIVALVIMIGIILISKQRMLF
jgi:hypothetical protein